MHFKKSLFGTSRTLAPRAEEKLLKKKNQIVWQSVNCLLACLLAYYIIISIILKCVWTMSSGIIGATEREIYIYIYIFFFFF